MEDKLPGGLPSHMVPTWRHEMRHSYELGFKRGQLAAAGEEAEAGNLPFTLAGSMRASDTDRQQVLDTLQNAFIAGYIPAEELDARQAYVLSAVMRDELGAPLRDIPAGELAAREIAAAGAEAAPRAVTRRHMPQLASGLAVLFVPFIVVLMTGHTKTGLAAAAVMTAAFVVSLVIAARATQATQKAAQRKPRARLPRR